MAGDDVNKNQTGDGGKKTQNEGEMIDHNSPFYLHASDYPKQMHVNEEKFGKESAPKAYELKQSLATTRQDGKERTYEFLMGLDDQFSVIKTQILAMKPTPDLSAVYYLVAEDEQQRTIASSKGSEKGWTKNKSGFQADKTKKCSECGRERHNKSGCFKIIGYPEWWQGKGKGDKSKPKAAMVEMKQCPIPGMTKEQYAMFLKLFGENREEPVIANMAGNMSVNDNWVVDSGTTEHITHQGHLLKNLFMNTIERPVTIPNEESIDEPAPHFITFEPKAPTRDGILEPKLLRSKSEELDWSG
nr:hypothetical protein [Tanacetum cinerariifolium]